MSDVQGIAPVTDDERKQIADCAAVAQLADNTMRALLDATDAEHVTAIFAREAITGGDLDQTDLAWLYAYTAVRLAGLTADHDRYREHSTTLNTISWKIAQALGDVPAGADQIEGSPVGQAERLIAKLEQARAAFQAETAKRLEDAVTIADLRAQLDRGAADDRERIARAIEVKQGDRCPTCQGRAANWETAARCGGGHRWTRPNRDTLAHVDFAAIARAGGAA